MKDYHPSIYFIVGCILVCFLTIVFCLKFLIQLWQLDYPQEYREEGAVLTTGLLLKSQNPYALDLMPVHVNVYGYIYNLVTLPFAKIFTNSIILHRIISFTFMIFATLIIYLELLHLKVSRPLALIAGFFLFIQMFIYGVELLARSDSLGLSLFLLSVIIPFRYSFNRKGLMISFIFSLLGFFTKTYFMAGILFIATYIFIFQSKIKGIIYIVLSMLLIVTVVLIFNHFFPTYIFNTIFIHYAEAPPYDYNHLFNQIKTFLTWNFAPLFILIIITSKLSNVKLQIHYYWICFMEAALLIFFSLGLHRGAYMTYFTQILTPFLLLISFSSLSRISGKILYPVLILILFNLSFWLYHSYQLPDLSGYKTAWLEWEKLFIPVQNVYNEGPLSLILDRQGKVFFNNGQTEYFRSGLKINRRFPILVGAEGRLKGFQEQINQSIALKKFDMIVIPEYPYYFFDPVLLASNYNFVQFKEVPMYKAPTKMQIYYPKK